MKKISQLIIFTLTLAVSSCVDQSFDLPPTTGIDPGLIANTYIADLKALHLFGQYEEITEDLIIRGTVVADDRSGNWFRSFVIQDETGGIEVQHTQADAYVFYMIGREIFIKCQGLWLGDFNNLTQLGGYTYVEDGGTEMGPIFDLTKHIFTGVMVGEPAPKVTTINALNDGDISTLVRLENVQFIGSDVEQTYADVIGRSSVNRTIEDCDGNEITLRTSGFAEFANQITPTGKGTITGIYSVFGFTKQLFIRELTDVVMEDSRCGDGPDPDSCTTTPPVVEELEMDFQNFSDDDDVMLTGWTNQAVSSSRLWRAQEYQGNLYAQATAFGDNSGEPMEAWLVSPAFDFSVPKVMNFESAMAFWDHDGMSVWISFDFECDVTKATWEKLDIVLAGQNDGDNNWVPSGDVDLSAYSEIGVIGFKYVGQGPEEMATSFRIDNLIIEDQ